MKTPTFLEIQPKLWQSLYILFRENAALSPEDLTAKITTVLAQYGFDPTLATITATNFCSLIYDKVVSTTAPVYYENSEECHACIAYTDVHDILYKISSESEQDPRIARLLLALIVYARTYPHPSNWIRFNRREIFHLAGLLKLSTREQDILTSRLHSAYGFDMQVIGSTQPIPCFRINWLTPITEDNPLIDMGRFLPQTLKDYAAKYLYSSAPQNTLNTL